MKSTKEMCQEAKSLANSFLKEYSKLAEKYKAKGMDVSDGEEIMITFNGKIFGMGNEDAENHIFSYGLIEAMENQE